MNVRQIIILLAAATCATATSAQESANPPTLKLDRIPSLPAFAGQTRAPAAATSAYTVTVFADSLSSPWALVFLPGGEILLTENTGTMRIVHANGRVSPPLRGLPEISHEGWSGLFDVVLDPQFERNRLLYFSYTAPSGDADAPNIPRVARAKLDRDALSLTDVEILLEGKVWQELAFAPDGKLLAAGTTSVGQDDAQNLANYAGKLLRVNADGTIPRDNPWSTNEDVPSEIFTYGHRDISGIATHPLTGAIWISEHGPRGGDEINIIHAGANYGWPVISYGTEYSGEPVGSGTTQQEGMQQPVYFWRPSIAPSGLMFYTGSMFPEWRGNLFVSALSGEHISRLVLDGDRVVAEERLLVDRAERIRELKEGPDGALYALTNEPNDAEPGTARLLRISK